MSPSDEEAAHLVRLMADPFRENFKEYCWAKAIGLAQSDPERYFDLPEKLKAIMLANKEK